MAADQRYHVKINGKGYVLIDESYAVQPQRPFNPRFSTGDPSLGDLSFWQFLSQSSFIGGAGQEVFEDTTKYLEAPGWDVRDGRPRLSLGRFAAHTSVGTPDTATQICDRFVPNGYEDSTFALHFEGSGALEAGTLALIGLTSNATLLSKHAIEVIRSNTAVSGGTSYHHAFAVTVQAATEVLRFLPDLVGGGALLNVSLNADMVTAQGVAQVTSDVFIVFGVGASGPCIEVVTLNANAWTVASQVYCRLSIGTLLEGNSGFVNSYGIDSNGTLYLAITNIKEIAASPTAFTTPAAKSILLRFTAADMVATNPRVSAIDQFQYDISAIESFAGSVYLFGTERVGAKTHDQVVVKYQNSVVWRSRNSYTPTTSRKNLAIRGTYKTSNGILFLAASGNSSLDSVYLLGASDAIREVYAIPRSTYGSGETVDAGAIADIGGRFLVYHRSQSTVYSSNSQRGGHAFDAELKLSKMGGNTELIEKSLYGITVRISEVLPSDGSLKIYSNNVLVGTMVAADGLEKEFVPENEVTASSFTPRIVAPAGLIWSGYVDKVTVRYLPTQFKKLAWGFAVRATKSLKLLNGQFEERSPEDVVADLKAAWAANAPLEFVDIDGETYSAIVTEFKARMPLAADKVKDREFLVSLELLEV